MNAIRINISLSFSFSGTYSIGTGSSEILTTEAVTVAATSQALVGCDEFFRTILTRRHQLLHLLLLFDLPLMVFGGVSWLVPL
jgi:hypothetical protein